MRRRYVSPTCHGVGWRLLKNTGSGQTRLRLLFRRDDEGKRDCRRIVHEPRKYYTLVILNIEILRDSTRYEKEFYTRVSFNSWIELEFLLILRRLTQGVLSRKFPQRR